MNPTNDQIRLVKQTWKSIRDVSTYMLGDVFYGKLFSENPELEDAFSSDMENNYMQLREILGMAVNRIDRPEDLKLAIELVVFGQEHNIRPADYNKMAQALLWTFQQKLGNYYWTQQIHNAWATCIAVITSHELLSLNNGPDYEQQRICAEVCETCG